MKNFCLPIVIVALMATAKCAEAKIEAPPIPYHATYIVPNGNAGIKTEEYSDGRRFVRIVNSDGSTRIYDFENEEVISFGGHSSSPYRLRDVGGVETLFQDVGCIKGQPPKGNYERLGTKQIGKFRCNGYRLHLATIDIDEWIDTTYDALVETRVRGDCVKKLVAFVPVGPDAAFFAVPANIKFAKPMVQTVPVEKALYVDRSTLPKQGLQPDGSTITIACTNFHTTITKHKPNGTTETHQFAKNQHVERHDDAGGLPVYLLSDGLSHRSLDISKPDGTRIHDEQSGPFRTIRRTNRDGSYHEERFGLGRVTVQDRDATGHITSKVYEDGTVAGQKTAVPGLNLKAGFIHLVQCEDAELKKCSFEFGPKYSLAIFTKPDGSFVSTESRYGNDQVAVFTSAPTGVVLTTKPAPAAVLPAKASAPVAPPFPVPTIHFVEPPGQQSVQAEPSISINTPDFKVKTTKNPASGELTITVKQKGIHQVIATLRGEKLISTSVQVRENGPSYNVTPSGGH